MRVLIIADGSFSPNNVIGAVRWTKIAKYLSIKDTQVYVIAQNNYVNKSDSLLIRDADYCKSVIYVKMSFIEKCLKTLFQLYGCIKHRSQVEIDATFWSAIHMKKAVRLIAYYGFSIEAKKIIRKYKLKFDVVISTNPLSAHWAAMYAARKFNTPWIADFRDPLATPLSKTWYNQWMLKWQNRICKKANHIITVSKGLKTVLGSERNGLLEKTSVIYNGYDPEDRN